MNKLDTRIKIHLIKNGTTVALLEGSKLSKYKDRPYWYLRNEGVSVASQLIISDSKLKYISIFGMDNHEVKSYSLDI